MHGVLLVEDASECQLVVKRALAGSEIRIATATSLADAKAILQSPSDPKISLILLDLGLPDGDGLALLDFLEATPPLDGIPVFLLTGKTELACKVAAFGLGAEDYLVKPIDPIELRARVEMRLRKSSGKRQNASVLKKGNLSLSTALMRATVVQGEREEALDLTSKEFKLLAFLLQNAGQAYSRPDLVKAIWGESVHVLDRTVDSHICSLRKKLGSLASLVECIPGVGYRFCDQPPKMHNSIHSNQIR